MFNVHLVRALQKALSMSPHRMSDRRSDMQTEIVTVSLTKRLMQQ